MSRKFDKLASERPEALDAADAPVGRKLDAGYVLDVLPAHVHQRLAAKAAKPAGAVKRIAATDVVVAPVQAAATPRGKILKGSPKAVRLTRVAQARYRTLAGRKLDAVAAQAVAAVLVSEE